jgi:hypothetical protein
MDDRRGKPGDTLELLFRLQPQLDQLDGLANPPVIATMSASPGLTDHVPACSILKTPARTNDNAA